MTLRFREIEIREIRIPFRFAFTHASAARACAHQVIVRLTTDGGHCGYGEALPREYLTGETIETIFDDLRSRWWPALQALRFDAATSPLQRLDPIYREADAARRTASYAAADVAAVHAWACACGRPVSSLLPRRFSEPPPCGVIGFGQPVGLTAAILARCGVRHLKIKTGRPDDLARIASAARAAGKKTRLHVDANGAWTPAEAVEMGRKLLRMGVQSVEQPIAAGDPESLATVGRETGLPVVADESLCTLEDARSLLAARAASLWNLRLAKVGGFSGLVQMAQLASENSIGLRLGCLVGETSLLAQATRACCGWFDFGCADMGFSALLLSSDPFRHAPPLFRRQLRTERQETQGPPKRRVLEKFTLRCETLSA